MAQDGMPISPVGKDPREFRYIPANALEIDPGEQRDVDAKRQRKIVTMALNWTWNRCECLTVRETPTGWKVIEGQGRARAMQMRDPDAEMPCMVISGIDRGEAAEVAAGIAKNRTNHEAADYWKLAVRSGSPAETAVQHELDMRGLHLNKSASANGIACASVLLHIIKAHVEPADAAISVGVILDTLRKAFPDEVFDSTKDRWSGTLVRALWRIIRDNDIVDTTRLARILSVRPARQWLNIGREANNAAAEGIAQALVTEYNKKMVSGRLQ